ncbi:hypothetical protein [Methylocapsa palsarum]|uniref:Lectin-like protein BA14k n=1 Tax=Methylocapsa palsarum TaxID=1612308 RepID=A0A1I4AJI2_9HYPH|nr:hypothetical protein [Methylocapsa palsarum]SFK56514.1 hypothetical protein SAMN05444581_110142 [Methylocapsa palsarum]
MNKARKFVICGLAALVFSASIAAPTPAEAWYRGGWGGGWRGGPGWGWGGGWRGGWGGGGWGGGWGWGGPALAAGVLGGLALGSVAAAAPYYGYSYPYGYSAYPYAAYPYAGYPYGGYAYAAPRRLCRVRSPVFDAWGRFAGYRRLRVSC